MNTDDFSTESVGERELTERNRAYAILRNRDLRLYLSGRLIAIIGQQMLAMAVGWELFHRTQSVLMLAFVGLAQVTPMILLTLPAGHLADNFSRKKIITLMTLVMATSTVENRATISRSFWPMESLCNMAGRFAGISNE